ncbi:MAG: S-methyl-5'-thioinosine phosphorylase [Halieaceae bacterium]|nr:S-methyl-5'-thioinosine phosphorylase [Halieaceae bacterium]
MKQAINTGVIGGTGLSEMAGLTIVREHAVSTPFGACSGAISEGILGDGQRLFFLHRHGPSDRPIPPHRVNYRANLWALRELGVNRIIAANAVGAINAQLKPGRLVIPDQLIDYTWGREHSFDDGERGHLLHVDFTEPFDSQLRRQLLAASLSAAVPCEDGAVVAVVQGPRLETAAEVRRLARDGCDLVGMTTMPEAALARELAIPYAAVAMVVNAAAGLDDRPISLSEIHEALKRETQLFAALVAAFLVAAAAPQADQVQ